MSKRLSLEEKACRVIEILVSDDFCENLELHVSSENNKGLSPEAAKFVAKKLSTIYIMSHAANPNNGCYPVHDDWRKEIERKYNYFRRKGYFKKIGLTEA